MSAKGTRRDLAVARVLDPARERAETRVQRFLDAALELLNTNASRDFTVQEVVEKSGQSLRSFYQYFDGKYELLLALFEDSIRMAAATLSERVERESEPLARLRAFCVEYHGLVRQAPKDAAKASNRQWPGSALGEFAQQLLSEHPAEASRAFGPLVELLEELVTAAVTTGDVRDDIPVRQVVGTVLQVVMFNPFATVIAGRAGKSSDVAEDLWKILFEGLRAQ
ncbi:MAG TPA: TetR/AcrR family transcriptional regulator [Nocardioides sp.]|nr:TetR/AcrR family transcriptional regulator [Nocardioides sp.]